MTTAVAEKKSAELSTDLMDDILGFAGEGTSFSADEMQIPFVRALQALSPQLGKKKPEYIEGAEQGDLYNTVTGEVWKGEDGVTIVPCYQFCSAPPALVRRKCFPTATSSSSQTSTTAW